MYTRTSVPGLLVKAEEFNQVHEQLYPRQPVSIDRLDSYLKHVRETNERIARLNETIGRMEPGSWDLYQSSQRILGDLLASNELRWLVSNIYNLRRDLTQRLDRSYY